MFGSRKVKSFNSIMAGINQQIQDLETLGQHSQDQSDRLETELADLGARRLEVLAERDRANATVHSLRKVFHIA